MEHEAKLLIPFCKAPKIRKPSNAQLKGSSSGLPSIGSPELLLKSISRTSVPEKVHLFDRGDFKGADDAEADPLGVGVIPDGFGLLRVFGFPPLFGEFAGR